MHRRAKHAQEKNVEYKLQLSNQIERQNETKITHAAPSLKCGLHTY